MSALNTVTDRVQSDRRRPIGSVSIADADQRGGGVFGFPQLPAPGQGPLAQLRDRLFGGSPTAQPATATPTAPLTDIPAVGPGGAESLQQSFPGLTPNQVSVIEQQFTPADVASNEESARVAAENNRVLGEALGIIQGAAPGGSALSQQLKANLLETPQAIAPEVQQAAISAATDAVLGRENVRAQNTAEQLALRGQSAGSPAAIAAGIGASARTGRDIAEARRDVLLQSGLAQSAREVQQNQQLLQRLGQTEPLRARLAETEAGLTLGTEVPAIDFADPAANEKLDAVIEAETEEDAERRLQDFVATLIGGGLALGLGQLVRRRLG